MIKSPLVIGLIVSFVLFMVAKTYDAGKQSGIDQATSSCQSGISALQTEMAKGFQKELAVYKSQVKAYNSALMKRDAEFKKIEATLSDNVAEVEKELTDEDASSCARKPIPPEWR